MALRLRDDEDAWINCRLHPATEDACADCEYWLCIKPPLNRERIVRRGRWNERKQAWAVRYPNPQRTAGPRMLTVYYPPENVTHRMFITVPAPPRDTRFRVRRAYFSWAKDVIGC